MSRKRKAKREARIKEHKREHESDWKEQEEELEMEVPEIIGESIEGKEQEEKMLVDVPYRPTGGSITFEELDAYRDSESRMEKARELMFDAEAIMRNITYSDRDNPGTAFSAVAEEMSRRFKKIFTAPSDMKEDGEEGEFDFDVAQAEMMLRQSNESTFANFSNYVTRAVLSSEARNKLPDSAFAYVRTVKGKKVRKYPIHDKAHVRNALSRAAQQIKSGGEGATIARAALPKIRAAARKFGIGAPSKEMTNSLMVMKDNEDNYRWVGWYSNNFKDREGDIISEAAHKEYLDWLDEHPQFAPTFRIWHTPGTDRKEQADWWDYKNGFVVMSGKLTEKEAQGLLDVGAKHKIGMSHGFFILSKEDNVIHKYRTFEVSDLPLERAANPWTTVEAIQKEVAVMAKDRSAYISAQLGEDFVAELETETAKEQENLRDLDVEEKEDDTEDTPVDIEQVLKAVGDEYGMTELSEWVETAQKAIELVPELQKEIAELKKSEDEKIAEKIRSPLSETHFAWQKRASQSDETELDEDDEIDKELKDQKPSWFGEVVASESV